MFLKSVPPLMNALLAIPILTTVMTPGLAILALLAWKNRWWSLSGRLHYTSLTLATLAFIGWLHHWNLLGWRY